MRATLALLVALVLAVACEPLSEPGDLDPDAPPVTDGGQVRPTADATWQWQLLGDVNDGYDVDVYDIDLFDVPAADITALQDDGRVVICYFSAGSYEDFRPDRDEFESTDYGRILQGFDGEWWLDVRSANVHRIMQERLDLAVDKGCDGVEPDNVDGFTNATGFDLTATDQLAFNRFVANEARTRGLAVGLKNDGDQAEDLVEYYDFSVNEQCHEFDECDQLADFTAADKPIWNAEYPGDEADGQDAEAEVCASAAAADTRTLLLPLNLDDAWRISCD